MAKKKTKAKFDDDVVSNQIISKYGDIVEQGTKVLSDLQNFNTIGISPSLDLALGGGLREGSVVVMTGDPKVGKDQPISSIVYTPNGPVCMGDIKVGDVVCTPDGNKANVTGVFPQGVKDVYRITFNDGSTAECGIDHLWKVKKNDNRYPDNWKVLSLKEILDEGLYYSDRPKWRVPITMPVEFKGQYQQIPPYILGCLLGDGGIKKSVTITSADAEIIDCFTEYAKSIGLECKHQSRYDYRISDNKARVGGNKLLNHLKDLGLFGKGSHDKFIPPNYKYGSIESRLELIKGLMDTDGYNDRGVTAEYSTVSRQLALDVQELVQSLGYTCKVKQRFTKCNGKEFPSFRLRISGNNVSELFSLPRKIYNKERSKPRLTRTIRKVEKVRKEECQCIMIDHPDNLYLTDNFAVTHNTTTSLYFAAKAQAAGKNVFYFNTEGRLTKENFTGIKDLDVSKIKIIQATDNQPVVSAETFLNAIETYVKNTPNFVAIIDSVSNMVPQDELDGEVRGGVRAQLPRLLSMFFKRISNDVARTKAILIFITHNIANTGGSRWSPAKLADCGNMLQYQAGTNMVITHRGKWEETDESGNDVGQIANWVIKTSAAGGKPNSTAASYIRYGLGIDEVREICEIANELTFIKQAGAWYTITSAIGSNDKRILSILKKNDINPEDAESVEKFFKFQGMLKLRDFLEENEEMRQFLYDQIKEIL